MLSYEVELLGQRQMESFHSANVMKEVDFFVLIHFVPVHH